MMNSIDSISVAKSFGANNVGANNVGANNFGVNKLSRGFFGAIVATFLLASCASHTTSNMTIAEATAARDDAQVVVTGEVVQQLDERHMLLRDSSGQITVRFDEDALGKVKFAPDSRLRVMGKMDRNSERSVLEAKSIQVVK